MKQGAEWSDQQLIGEEAEPDQTGLPARADRFPTVIRDHIMHRFTPVLPTFCGPKSERCELAVWHNVLATQALHRPRKGPGMRSSEPRVGDACSRATHGYTTIMPQALRAAQARLPFDGVLKDISDTYHMALPAPKDEKS